MIHAWYKDHQYRILPMSLSSFILLRPVKIKHWNPSVSSHVTPNGLKFPKKTEDSSPRSLQSGIQTSSKAFFSACPIHLDKWIPESLPIFSGRSFPQKVTPAFQVTPCFWVYSSSIEGIKTYPNESSIISLKSMFWKISCKLAAWQFDVFNLQLCLSCICPN